MRKWRKRKIEEGYGKALYARRKHRFDNEKILREAVELAYELTKQDNPKKALVEIASVLNHALQDAPAVTGKPISYMGQK